MSPASDLASPEDAKAIERLEVYRDQEYVGELTRTRVGAIYAYDPTYVSAHLGNRLRAITFGMPVREKAYEVRGVNLHPFFAGLLPEGLRLRALVRGIKTSEDDLYSLLAAVGADTVGDVWVRRPDGELEDRSPLVEIRELAKSSFAELLEESMDWPAGGDRVSIAGVHPKVSAAMISFPVRARSRRRDYILKLSPSDYPGLVENEAFFMGLARSVGVAIAKVKLVQDRDGISGLLVERFDRVPREGAGAAQAAGLQRLHQEDACQLLDRYPADKYRLDLKEIAEALDVCSAPMVERLGLLRLQALSYLIVNGDLHAKNISVQILGQGTKVSLTPAYDLVCTLPYGDIKLALPIEGRDEGLKRSDFVAFGERLGIRKPAIERMLDTLITRTGAWVPRLDEIGLSEKKTRHLDRVMRERLDALGN